jgi:hypothetical protein
VSSFVAPQLLPEAEAFEQSRLSSKLIPLRLCNAMSENSAFLAKFFPIFVSFVFFCKNILVAALPR